MVIVNQEKLGDEVSLVKYNHLIQESRQQIPKSANFVLEFQFQKDTLSNEKFIKDLEDKINR